jgi:hypothetical protein
MRNRRFAISLIQRDARWLCAAALLLFVLTVVAARAIAQDTGAAHPTIDALPPFQPPAWVDERDDVVRFRQWLPDGRLAIAGNTAPRENGYLRVIDPKTMAEEDYYMVGGDGIGPIDRFTPSVVVIGDAVFFLNGYGNLMRGTKQHRLMVDIDLGFNAEEYAEADSGVILADGNSVLVSWWESVPSKKGYCGDGPVVARLSAEGRILWRWQDRQGGDNFPNDMVTLKDGTILILVEGHSLEHRGSMWEVACGHGYEYLVALSPNGHEIARRSVPRGTWLQKLSLGWNGNEVITAGGYLYEYVNELVRIRVEGGYLKFDRVPLSRIVSIDPGDDVAATSLEEGGFNLDVGPHPIRLRIDESGRIIDVRDLNPPRETSCHPQGNRYAICSDPKTDRRLHQ